VASHLRILSASSTAPIPALIPDAFGAPEPARAPVLPLSLPLPGPGLDLDSLRCFEAVATTLRFRTAAARVHLSPAAFSERIRRLEEGLGTRVLTRTTRSVTLTDGGQRLLPLARNVLGMVDRMPGTVAGGATVEPYELVIGTRYEVGLSWLCPALGPLARKRPERTLHLYNGSSSDLVGALERGQLDAIVASVRLSSNRLSYAALHEESYALVGADATLRGRDDARRLTLVDIAGDLPLFRYFLDADARAEPWSFARTEYMGGIANVRTRLLEGEGRVGVLPTFFIKQDLLKGRLRRLMPGVRLKSDTLRLVWRTGYPRESALLTLAQDLRTFPLR
jgi:DNA-binding transcriptional LysR family regulator